MNTTKSRRIRRCMAMTAGAVVVILAIGPSISMAASAPGDKNRIINGCEIVANPTRQHHTVCNRADLNGANLDHLDLSWAVLNYAALNHASLNETNFTLANLIHASLDFISSDKTNFTNASLDDATLKDVHLAGPNFYNADLQTAVLNRADLQHPNFTSSGLFRADLDDAQIRDAVWNMTVCPDGAYSSRSGNSCEGHLWQSFWTHIMIDFEANHTFVATDCNAKYGDVGTQECNGKMTVWPRPDPSIGPWPFTDNHDGTSKATTQASGAQIVFALYTPGGEISGVVPNESSDRYTVNSAIIGNNRTAFVSPPNNPDIGAGDKGGPLHLNVAGGCTIFKVCKYTFEVKGWVRARPPLQLRTNPA